MILVCALLVPTEKVDVALLRPIEVIYVCAQGDCVLLQTDTDDLGIGTDAASALENMKQTSPAVIYLDTAKYLLIGPGGEKPALQLRQTLKDKVKLCGTENKISLKLVASYLPVHNDLPSFSAWETGVKLPQLIFQNNQIKLS